MTKRKAFTLLEILIVVAILSLLLTILFPALARAKIAAKRTVCLTNLRGFAHALADYAAMNSNRLPPTYYSSPPYGAKNPTDTWKVLNSYLKSDSFRALQCPSDAGGSPGSETSLFDNDGYSYWYASDTTGSSLGISPVVGSVSWQESKMGSLPPITQEQIRKTWHYYDPGPEEQPDPNGTNPARQRDVTKDEIDNQIWPAIQSAWQSYAGQEGFNISTGAFNWGVTLQGTNPPTNPPTKMADTGNHKASPPWNVINPWSRPIYVIDYWNCSSKKIVAMDRDAFLTGNTGGLTPRPLRGFWHDYPWTPGKDANGNTLSIGDAHYYDWAIVKVHAGFLDGHAEAIELNHYGTVTDSAGNYRCDIHPDIKPDHSDACSVINRDHLYY